MKVAGKGIPGRSLDDVRQHDEWYSEYLILKESKKKAIQEWKQNKEVGFLVIFIAWRGPTQANSLVSHKIITKEPGWMLYLSTPACVIVEPELSNEHH